MKMIKWQTLSALILLMVLFSPVFAAAGFYVDEKKESEFQIDGNLDSSAYIVPIAKSDKKKWLGDRPLAAVDSAGEYFFKLKRGWKVVFNEFYDGPTELEKKGFVLHKPDEGKVWFFDEIGGRYAVNVDEAPDYNYKKDNYIQHFAPIFVDRGGSFRIGPNSPKRMHLTTMTGIFHPAIDLPEGIIDPLGQKPTICRTIDIPGGMPYYGDFTFYDVPKPSFNVRKTISFSMLFPERKESGTWWFLIRYDKDAESYFVKKIWRQAEHSCSNGQLLSLPDFINE